MKKKIFTRPVSINLSERSVQADFMTITEKEEISGHFGLISGLRLKRNCQ